jgi:Xaa-Pro dipeptidase
MAAFGLNFCHGLGLGLHERPLISRLNSFIEPYELKAGMVFAVETFCPAKDGVSAARIEEGARRTHQRPLRSPVRRGLVALVGEVGVPRMGRPG